jgi:dUTP pyrophosphatase
MKLCMARVDSSLPLPTYHSAGAVAFDLYSRIDLIIPPFEVVIAPTNLIVEVPKGYVLLLQSRSSLPIKKKLMVANSVGVIDQDYHGPEDEIGIELINFSKHDVAVARGERIAQAMLVSIAKIDEFVESDMSGDSSRGGFGSTGS